MKRHIRKNEPVCWRMKRAREERGLTLSEVAEATNYSYGAVALAENGKRYQGTKKDVRRDAFWETMSEFFKVPAEELKQIGDEENE